MSSEDDFNDFNLKKSKFIGELYPVLKDARGNIIDGNHRLQADPNWKIEVHPEIDTDEKLVLAQLASNWQKRQLTPQEKAKWINDLAEIYKKQGYKTLISGNEIVRRIVEVAGLSQPTVNKYLDDKYKVFTDEDRVRRSEISAHERIKRKFGEEFAKRNEQEIVKKHMHSSKDLRSLYGEEERKETNEIQEREPALADILVAQGESAVERICEPLGRFVALDVSILTSLDSQQREKVLTVLLEARKRIDEMVKALKDEK